MNNAALIAKLVEAPEGTRALSDEVLLACGWRHDTVVEGDWLNPEGIGCIAMYRPDPTRNLQDIVDLVPEGMTWGVGHDQEISGPYAFIGETGQDRKGEYARTPVLSLCIAILRAMETEAAGGTGENHE